MNALSTGRASCWQGQGERNFFFFFFEGGGGGGGGWQGGGEVLVRPSNMPVISGTELHRQFYVLPL